MGRYLQLPTAAAWKRDAGGQLVAPAEMRIAQLLEICEQMETPNRPNSTAFMRMELYYVIHRNTEFLLKYANMPEKTHSHLPLQPVALKAIADLRDYLDVLLPPPAMREQMFLEFFGRDVTDAGKEEDAHSTSIQWWEDTAARKQFKLAFRNGRAHRWRLPANGPPQLVVYDTKSWGDEIESGMSLYVMDGHGRIYVSGKEGEYALKHSSFLAGDPTAAAGTIKVEQGQVVWVTGRSGHYRPTVQQMCNLLERLKTYGVDLKLVRVFRENFTGSFSKNQPRNMEPIDAVTLFTQRRWPGKHPYEMRIG